MLSATCVAAELIRLAEADEDALTQMQLHKLLYYVQGLSLGLRGKPAFNDPIQAWQHGPVVPSVRKICGQGMHFPVEAFNQFSVPDNAERDFIQSVWIRFRDYSASALRKLSLDETPWIEATQRGQFSEITQQAMREFFTIPSDLGVDGMSILKAERDFAEGRTLSLSEVLHRLQLTSSAK
jgi:uncharacterized phage-associated protein